MSVWGFETVYDGPTKAVNGAFLSAGDITKDLPLSGTRYGVCLAPATKFNVEKINKLVEAKQVRIIERKNVVKEVEQEDVLASIDEVEEVQKEDETLAEDGLKATKPRGRPKKD